MRYPMTDPRPPRTKPIQIRVDDPFLELLTRATHYLRAQDPTHAWERSEVVRHLVRLGFDTMGLPDVATPARKRGRK